MLVYVCICMLVYVCMYTYVCICMYMYVCMYVCICMCVCMYVYVCIHVYVCMHNILGGIVWGNCPTQNGRGNCVGGIVQGNCPTPQLTNVIRYMYYCTSLVSFSCAVLIVFIMSWLVYSVMYMHLSDVNKGHLLSK